MIKQLILIAGSISFAAGAYSFVAVQPHQDPAELIAAQKRALTKLEFLDGQWRGEAWTMLPSGDKHTFTQTERVGPFLDASVRIIEGHGYEKNGQSIFNALGIISYDSNNDQYTMHSYAQGHTGDFELKAIENGFIWEIPAGPMTMRYTAIIENDTWHEIGERMIPNNDPVQFFEMTLTRIADTDWPAANPVSPTP